MSHRIEKLKAYRNCFLLYFGEEKREVKIHPEIKEKFNLTPGKILSEDKKRLLLEENDSRYAMESALKFLSFRAHSKYELVLKL